MSTQVRVRLKKDPSKVRLMTSRSFEANRAKWELAPEEGNDPTDKSDIAIEIMRSKKKGVVAAAPSADSDLRISQESANEIIQGLVEKTEFVDVSELSTEASYVPKGTIHPQKWEHVEDEKSKDVPLIDALRASYYLEAGKHADKRWSEARIKSEIEKLTTK